ncbi:MarR family winged helix-turn-helix transcriptional regulator [Pseudolysinimonas sp.]|uniref:MarR family winged helix-turn-helix transcriptional regulator n=1 Tax=Pseudolysinimonas sp. TaxID=2680009 RepID=UPI003F7F1471
MARLDDDELRLLVQRVARRIRSNRGDESMSDSQLGVLFLLDKIGDASPSRLAEHERVSPPSMNRTLNGLEERGLVRRTPSPDDARKVVVSITEAGLELIRETRRLRTAWFSRQLAALDAEERAALEAVVPVLRKLADA